MSEESITPQQVRVAMQAAGLDPSRPLNDQLKDDTAALQERIAALEAKLEARNEIQTVQGLTENERRQAAAAQVGQSYVDHLKGRRMGPWAWHEGGWG
jgi:phosphoglycerate-specific signal transduction histidine kinase